MTNSVFQIALSSKEEVAAAKLNEENAIARFHEAATRLRRSARSSIPQSDAANRKKAIFGLCASSAIALVSMASPAAAQYSAGGGTATGTNSVAIGTGSTADGIGAVAIGQNNDADSDDTTNQQIFDRVNGGTYSYASGDTGILSAGVAVGDNNTVTGGGGIAIGDSNQVINAFAGVAIGNGNVTSSGYGVSLGFGNLSSSTAAVAIGTANTASGNTSIAMGRQSTASGDTSIALGNTAEATGVNAIAFGHSALATADGSIAIGGGNNGASQSRDTSSANAAGINSVAVGTNSSASAGNALALGDSAAANNIGDVALGSDSVTAAPNSGAYTLNGGAASGTSPASVVSVGSAGNERQIQNVAAGILSASSTDAVNGSQLFIVATAANNLGNSMESVTGGGLAINTDGTIATPASISVGGAAYSNLTSAIEAGDDKADTGLQDVADALGGGSSYDPATGVITAPTYGVAGATQNSVGDAFAALNTANSVANSGLASAIGGGASVATDGTVAAPSVNVNGSTYTNLTDAIQAAGAGYSLTTAAIGTGSVSGTTTETIGAGETVTFTAADNLQATQSGNEVRFALNSDLSGINSLAVSGGPTLNGSGITLAAGNSFDAGGNMLTNVGAGAVNATSTDAVNGAQLFAITQAAGASADALGASVASNLGGSATYDPMTDTIGGLAINVGGTAYDNVTEAVEASDAKDDLANTGLADALGGGASVAPDGTVTGPTYNVAGGTQGNVGDTFSALDDKAMAIGMGLADALGGGAAMAPDGTITAPTFAVGGSTYNNAGDAFAAIDGELTGLAGGTSGLVQQAGGAPGTGNITVGAATGGMVVDVAGTDGERTLTGVLAGNLAAGSTDAVNGGQINDYGTSVANVIGGGAMFDPVTGTLRNPTIIVGGQNYTNVTEAIEASDAKADNANSGLADALGGGASVGPDGTVMAPAYNVQGGSFNNVGSALAAVDGEISNINTDIASLTNGTSGLIQQTGGAPGTGEISIGSATGGTSLNVAGTDGDRVITGVADGAVAAASNDAVNGSQLYAVSEVANGALQRSGGAMTGNIDMGGNAVTNVAGPVNAGDATNKAYVDGLAANAAATSGAMGASTANHLGGGSAYDTATGQVSAPSYAVGGQSYDNVGGAIAATNMLAVQYVADASGQPTNAVNLAHGGQSVGMSGLAAGAVNAASTDAVNGSQLYAVQQTANGAVQSSGGTMTGNLNFGGNRATGLAGPVDASDAATKGYVDALQNQNVNQFNLLTTGLNNAFESIERNSQGVALAIAMGGGFLSDDKDFSLWGAWGNFNGNNAAAIQTYVRLTDDTYINAAVSYGFEESLVGTRVGFGIQF